MRIEAWVLVFQAICGRAYCLVLLVVWVEKSCMGVSKSKEILEVAGGVFSIIHSVAGVSTGLELSTDLS